MRVVVVSIIAAALISGCSQPMPPLIAGLVPAPTEEGTPLKAKPLKIFNYTW
jgi:hypothetical protein